ncbi:MAG: mechanosensitive ion channel domain-containing protein [Halarcobacter sp.]
MKLLINFLLFCTLCFSAEIDTKLFDTQTNISYLKEIKKNIDSSNKSKKIIENEKKYLQILKEASAKTVSIEKFNYTLLDKKDLSLDEIYQTIEFLLDLNKKQNSTKNLLLAIQDNLSYLKKRIENIIEIEKDKLLIYQLQFAYYKIEKTNLEKKEALIKDEKIKLLSSLNESIPKLSETEIKTIDIHLNKNIENLDRLTQYINSLKVDLQREKLDENKPKVKSLENSIKKFENSYQEELIKTINNLSKKLLITLKDEQEKEFLATYKSLNGYISKLDEDKQKKYSYLSTIFKELSKKYLSNTKLLFASSSSQLSSIYDSSKSFFNTSLVVFNEQAITPKSIFKALILIIIGLLLGKFYKKWLLKISSKWPNIGEVSLKVTSNVGFYLIIFITIIIAMNSLGIDMSSISLIAGALSIGIGFGLQTVVSNFIAGIILMFERTIRIGDVIEINDVLKGTVTDIRVRSTTIKTFDNIDIVVPNSSFIQNNVINWTLEDKSRRLHVPFGVAYGTKIEEVKKIILEELKNSDLKFIREDKDKQAEIRFEGMNNSSVDLELLVYIRVNDRITPNSLKSDFLLLIYNALYKHNIEIPFPQLDLHIKKELKK